MRLMGYPVGALFDASASLDGVPPEAFASLYSIMQAGGIEDVGQPMQDLVAMLGYGGYGFGVFWCDGDGPGIDAPLHGGVLSSVLEAYAAAGIAQHDPLIHALLTAREPLFWADFADASGAAESQKGRRLFAMAGVKAGASIPVDIAALGCRAALAVAAAPGVTAEAFAENFTRNGWVLRLAAAALGLVCGDKLAASIAGSLSPSEVSVLECLANGKRPREIAEHLGKSEHTIRNQIVSAQNRLGVRTKEQAVAKALRFGLIAP